MTDFAPAGVPPSARPFEIMMAYGGVRETSPNRGPWIDKTLRFCKLEPDPKLNPNVPPGGYPWCCSSFVWCCHEAGERWVPRTASVEKLVALMPDGRWIAEPEIGCGIVHLGPKGNHILFCTGLTPDGMVQTISGNTNAEGGREGVLVGPHDKPRSYCTRFFRVETR